MISFRAGEVNRELDAKQGSRKLLRRQLETGQHGLRFDTPEYEAARKSVGLR